MVMKIPRYIESARKRLEDFTVQKQASRYEGMYEKVLARHKFEKGVAMGI
jgi:hypothetical protein